MEEYESKINSYINEGDWLELNDYLQNSQFEELVEKDQKFQRYIISIIKDLFSTIGFSDSKYHLGRLLNLPYNTSNAFCSESNAQDCFKTLLNLLLLSDNNEELNKLFLRACQSGHIEMVESFLEPNGDDIIDINYRDPSGKTCLHYAADGNGDNYDVVDLLLTRDSQIDKITRTKALFYFLEMESAQNTKPKSVREMIKRMDKLDLTYTNSKGREHC
jgi:hypothetical protein